MRSQKRLRDELRFVSEFNTLFDVVQQVAVSQLRRTEEQLVQHISVTELLTRTYLPLLPASAARHPLVQGGPQGRLLLVFTSDEGLVGPLHAAVIRRAQELADPATQWVCVGQRGARMAGDLARRARAMPLPPDEEAEGQMQRLGRFVLDQYQRGALKDVWVVAARFLSTTRQDVVAFQMLPLPIRQGTDAMRVTEVVLEPSVARIIDVLAAMWVGAVCVETFWSARRAELAARALHVEVSRQELAKRARLVHREFFKTMHERVDVLVRETCGVQRRLASARDR